MLKKAILSLIFLLFFILISLLILFWFCFFENSITFSTILLFFEIGGGDLFEALKFCAGVLFDTFKDCVAGDLFVTFKTCAGGGDPFDSVKDSLGILFLLLKNFIFFNVGKENCSLLLLLLLSLGLNSLTFAIDLIVPLGLFELL